MSLSKTTKKVLLHGTQSRGRKVLIGAFRTSTIVIYIYRESIFFLPLRLLQRGCVEAVEAIEAGLSNDIDLLNGSFPSWETLDRSRQLPPPSSVSARLLSNLVLIVIPIYLYIGIIGTYSCYLFSDMQ